MMSALVFALRYKIIRRDERYILAVDHSLEQCDYVIVVIRDMLSRATVIFHFILFWGSIVSCRMTGYVSLFSFGKTLLSMQHDGRGAPIGPWPSWP